MLSPESQINDQPNRPIGPADVVRWILAAVLLLAAGLKVEQLASEPVNNCGQFSCRWMSMVEVEAEILLGLWMLSGIARDYARIMGGICFAAFAGVTFLKAVGGDASCGCFGKVQVNPWYTLVLDLLAVAALGSFRQSGSGLFSAPRARRASACFFAIMAILVAGLSSWAMFAYQPARLTRAGEIQGEGAVLLDPADWTGRALPLLTGHFLTTEPAVNLGAGQWTLILYRSTCRVCQRELAGEEDRARQLAAKGQPVRTVVAELPPVAGAGQDVVKSDSPLHRARLDDRRKWFVHTPLIVTLNNGIVTRVTTID